MLGLLCLATAIAVSIYEEDYATAEMLLTHTVGSAVLLHYHIKKMVNRKTELTLKHLFKYT